MCCKFWVRYKCKIYFWVCYRWLCATFWVCYELRMYTANVTIIADPNFGELHLKQFFSVHHFSLPGSDWYRLGIHMPKHKTVEWELELWEELLRVSETGRKNAHWIKQLLNRARWNNFLKIYVEMLNFGGISNMQCLENKYQKKIDSSEFPCFTSAVFPLLGKNTVLNFIFFHVWQMN